MERLFCVQHAVRGNKSLLHNGTHSGVKMEVRFAIGLRCTGRWELELKDQVVKYYNANVASLGLSS